MEGAAMRARRIVPVRRRDASRPYSPDKGRDGVGGGPCACPCVGAPFMAPAQAVGVAPALAERRRRWGGASFWAPGLPCRSSVDRVSGRGVAAPFMVPAHFARVTPPLFHPQRPCGGVTLGGRPGGGGGDESRPYTDGVNRDPKRVRSVVAYGRDESRAYTGETRWLCTVHVRPASGRHGWRPRG